MRFGVAFGPSTSKSTRSRPDCPLVYTLIHQCHASWLRCCCEARLFITWRHHKGYHQAALRQPAHTMRLDRAISRHRKVGSQIAEVLGPGWRLKDNENMHDSWTWDETENGPSPCTMHREAVICNRGRSLALDTLALSGRRRKRVTSMQ